MSEWNNQNNSDVNTKKSKDSAIFKILFVIFVAVFVVAVGIIASNIFDSSRNIF